MGALSMLDLSDGGKNLPKDVNQSTIVYASCNNRIEYGLKQTVWLTERTFERLLNAGKSKQ